MDKTANEPRYAKFLSAVKLVARKLKELREAVSYTHLTLPTTERV